MVRRVKVIGINVVVIAAISLFSIPVGAEAPLQSTNYRFDEGTIGTSGYLDAGSANYSATSGVGSLSVGPADSSGYQAQEGSRTTADPTLSFSIGSGNIAFGSFSPTTATTATGSFTVSNYSSYGYVVQIAGTAPANGTHTISPLATSDISRSGVEQFGINLVANTLPRSVGLNPNNGQFGFGSAATNYATSNQYRYVSGETIAQATKSSGTTSYTITFLSNVSSLTPAGAYVSNQTLLVTGTY